MGRGRGIFQLVLGALVVLAVSLLTLQTQDQPTELDAIYKRRLELYLSEKYAEAVPVAEAYIAVAKAKFGEPDPLYAKGLLYHEIEAARRTVHAGNGSNRCGMWGLRAPTRCITVPQGAREARGKLSVNRRTWAGQAANVPYVRC